MMMLMMMMANQTFGGVWVLLRNLLRIIYRYINPLKLVAIWEEEGFVKQQFTIFMWMKRVVLSHSRIHHCPAHNPPIYLLTWCLHLSLFLFLSPHLTSPHLTSPPMGNQKRNSIPNALFSYSFEVHFLDMNLSSLVAQSQTSIFCFLC
jgi:hypothetical protein